MSHQHYPATYGPSASRVRQSKDSPQTSCGRRPVSMSSSTASRCSSPLQPVARDSRCSQSCRMIGRLHPCTSRVVLEPIHEQLKDPSRDHP